MAITFTKTTWVDLQDPYIDAAQLNRIENAIGSLVTVANDAVVKTPTTSQWIVGQYLGVERATVGATSFANRVTGDAYARLSIVDNIIKFGPGNADQDVTLYRTGVGAIGVDGIIDVGYDTRPSDPLLRFRSTGREQSIYFLEAGSSKAIIGTRASNTIFRIASYGIDDWLSVVLASGGLITIGGSTNRAVNFTGAIQTGATQRISNAGRFDATSVYSTSWQGTGIRPLAADAAGQGYVPSVAAFLSALGISSFVQTILDDADGAAVRSTIGAQGSLGYTPVNTAGDTMTGKLAVGGTGGGFTPSIMSDGVYGIGVHDGSMTSGYRTAGFRLRAASGADPNRLNLFFLSDNMLNLFNSGYFGLDGSVGASAILQLDASSRTQLVGSRKTGWTPWTGTASRASRATRTTVTASSTYTQSEITALMQDVQYLMQGVKALIDDLHATSGHGLIGA